MTKNPFINALLAAVYIVIIALAMNLFQSLAGKPDTIFIPMTMLGLFVLSAAIMGYLFVYQPFVLYFDNKKQEAVSFFLKTVGFFAIFAVIFIILMLVAGA